MRSPMRGSADEACRSIADDGDCLDDRAGGDLAQGHRVEVLCAGHPVVVGAPTLNATQATDSSTPLPMAPAASIGAATMPGNLVLSRRSAARCIASSITPQPKSTSTSQTPSVAAAAVLTAR